MKPIISLPKQQGFMKPKYWESHCKYLIDIFQYEGYPIQFFKYKQSNEVVFEMKINDVLITVDFSDHIKIHSNNRPLIKYHLDKNTNDDSITPIPPISFYDWNEYFTLEKEINYSFKDNIVNCQTPGGRALERRIFLRSLIENNFANHDTKITDKISFWKKINTAKVAIFAPGARIDILDRGHLQYLAFGCCTISPEINDKVTFGKQLIPDVHYIKCANDFSDVIDIVNSLDKNKCLTIGQNAKQFFKETCLPNAIIKNILNI